MPLYFWDNWISTWMRRLEWVESLCPLAVLHSQWIVRLSCTMSTQDNCWCAGPVRKDGLSPHVPSDYTAVTGVRFHALFDGETLPKRVEMLSHEGPRKCCQNFGSTFGAEKWSEICQLQRVTPEALPKLSDIGWCFTPNWHFETQIYADLCQCPVSRETKWCHLGFYPERAIQCWVGHESQIRCVLMRSSVANATLWPWQVDSFKVNPHSMSYWIEGRWWMKSTWCVQMLACAKRQSMLSASWECGMSSPVKRTGLP